MEVEFDIHLGSIMYRDKERIKVDAVFVTSQLALFCSELTLKRLEYKPNGYHVKAKVENMTPEEVRKKIRDLFGGCLYYFKFTKIKLNKTETANLVLREAVKE